MVTFTSFRAAKPISWSRTPKNGAVGATAGKGDIFRVHEKELNTNVTIAATDNALASGPLTVASGITLTIANGGRLAIV